MPMTAPTLPPPLRDGDCLTSAEFMRRWEAMPGLKHAELIDGIVYMPSPVSLKHSTSHGQLAGWLGYYAAHTPGCIIGVEGTWVMGRDDSPSPDIDLRILPEYGGQSRVDGEYGAGAPELVIEVAVTSQSRDLGPKSRLYERTGVREYIVAVAPAKHLIWKARVDGKFQPIEPDADGIIRSRCFPGLWLDAAALWSQDQARLFAVLHEGLATAEHTSFAAHLAAARR